jgi:2-dehydropantoate 2-reductase
MRFIILGAGSVGCAVGGGLRMAGHDVTVVARGDNLAALRSAGLRLGTPDGTYVASVDTAASSAEAGISSGDVVILATKSQDTGLALEALRSAINGSVAVVCLQNGVENERLALRLFESVYGAYVYIFASRIAPGEVHVYTSPAHGIIDVGMYPAGSDDACDAVSSAFRQGGFDSCVQPEIMRWKYSKLLANLSNAWTAISDDLRMGERVLALARHEAMECFRAGHISHVPIEVSNARRDTSMPLREVAGQPFPGGSTWQSLARGASRIEVDYLNGEVVLLGRLHGVSTPVNQLLQELAWSAARQGRGPRSMRPAELRAVFADLLDDSPADRGGPQLTEAEEK